MKQTRGVKILLGDYRKAILKLAAPMSLGLFVQIMYNLVDSIWVAGLGKNDLAAIGLFMPFMMIISAISMGIGTGGSTAISRAIGEKNHKKASNIADHTLIFGTLIGLLLSISLIPFLPAIFIAMGANHSVIIKAKAYGDVILLGAVFLYISNLGSAILRGEGDTKRAMHVMIISSLINLALDPILIYILKMGITGAAVATVISFIVSASVISYWLVKKKDTFVDINLRWLKPEKKIMKEIFKVGIPSMISQSTSSILMIAVNWLVISIAGAYGVAVLTGGFRILMIGMVPMQAISIGVSAVIGAAYGAKNANKMHGAYKYGIKIGFLIELAVVAGIILFAPQLALLFSYSKNSQELMVGITQFLRYTAAFLIAVVFSINTGALFRGVGEGHKALAVVLTRTTVIPIFAYILGRAFGIAGVWFSFPLGAFTAAAVAVPWGLWNIRKYSKRLS